LLQNKLKRLPAYLTIQMVRFCYKGKEGVNAKILKVSLSVNVTEVISINNIHLSVLSIEMQF